MIVFEEWSKKCNKEVQEEHQKRISCFVAFPKFSKQIVIN